MTNKISISFLPLEKFKFSFYMIGIIAIYDTYVRVRYYLIRNNFLETPNGQIKNAIHQWWEVCKDQVTCVSYLNQWEILNITKFNGLFLQIYIKFLKEIFTGPVQALYEPDADLCNQDPLGLPRIKNLLMGSNLRYFHYLKEPYYVPIRII